MSRPLISLLLLLGVATATEAASNSYKVKKLVADEPGKAKFTDTNLVNGWGVAAAPEGPVWVNATESGVSVVYQQNGKPFPDATNPLIVTIPPPPLVLGPGHPTGIVFNNSSDFVISNGTLAGPSKYLFASEDGIVAGWNPAIDATNALITIDESALDAVFKGITIGLTPTGFRRLYVTDFHNGRVRIYDDDFALVTSFGGNNLPAGFAPFNCAVLADELYVTFAKQLAPDNEDDEPGPGNGFVQVFDADGVFVRAVATAGPLNSPWGLALAPSNFGKFSNHLLVGNFGDGRINAFDQVLGTFLGGLQDNKKKPITIDGLWGLTFVPSATSQDHNVLFFAAGPEDEEHGLFGTIKH